MKRTPVISKGVLFPLLAIRTDTGVPVDTDPGVDDVLAMYDTFTRGGKH